MSLIKLSFVDIEACPLCGSKHSLEIDRGTDTLTVEINRYLPADNECLPTIMNARKACQDCGLLFLSPRLDDGSLSVLYDLWYRFAYRRIFDDEQHITDRMREFERYHLVHLQNAHPSPGSLLDIGCGNGLFLHLARRVGWSVLGIELDEETARRGRERFGLEIRSGVMADVITEQQQFDVITMFDYLEHTTTPGADLDAAIRHLRPGGIMMIRVPNVNGWQARLMGVKWLACISTHLAYFTSPVLVRALQQRGMTTKWVSAGNYQTEWDLVQRQWRWCKRRLPRRSRSGQMGQAPLSVPAPSGSLCSSISRYLYSLLLEQIDHVGGWFGFGNNLLVISHKAYHGSPQRDFLPSGETRFER
jgi:2-polyprenyl-3-methyl-5-hydroxy-6-metoxy-1,4-benzoquinol methylase